MARFRSMAGFAGGAGADQDVERVAEPATPLKVAGFLLDRRATDLTSGSPRRPGQ